MEKAHSSPVYVALTLLRLRLCKWVDWLVTWMTVKIGQVLPMSSGRGCAAARRGKLEGEFPKANYLSDYGNKGLSVDMF